jgi:hypothetical protein
MVTADYPNGAFLRMNLIGTELEETQLQSAFVGFYWAVVTATTTGYGDIYPTSVHGRALAVCCMFTGVLMLALPVTVLSANFNDAYDMLGHAHSNIAAASGAYSSAASEKLERSDDEEEDVFAQSYQAKSIAHKVHQSSSFQKIFNNGNISTVEDDPAPGNVGVYIKEIEAKYLEIGTLIKNLKTAASGSATVTES